ncbi:MAG: acyl-CoA dehydrogenase family protein [Acidobacteriota bacterium]
MLTLPGDDVRQVLWRLADRPDLQKLIETARAVARGPVARLVAAGGRHSLEWTREKADLLEAFDEAGLSRVGLGGETGASDNLALGLVAFELAWVDAGAATSNLAGVLALLPIAQQGTREQRETYLRVAGPSQSGGQARPRRGAFALTEPLPYAGVETALLGGKARVAEWNDGQEPILQIDKRGRYITGMDAADFVTAAVDSADPRIKGSCLVILDESDAGVFDRGATARKLVQQLSSTRDPIFSLRVPASRIVGGYTISAGTIVPACSHLEVIDAIFRRTRPVVGLMTAAKLLSAIEPLIRYHRHRFRGSDAVEPGSPRHELGLQQREDVLHRVVDVWAAGEAAAAIGFEAVRLFDRLDPLARKKDAALAGQGIGRGRGEARALAKVERDAFEYLSECARPPERRNQARHQELARNPLVEFVLLDAVADVVGPAVKLWNTGHGAAMMREAVSLMGGFGITEDCPGFLGYKWMDTQLEATYEGPEAVHRAQLASTMTGELFLTQFRSWAADMRLIASDRPGTGACTLASAMQMWLWVLRYLQRATDADGRKLYQGSRQAVSFALADGLSWMLAARQQTLDVLELERASLAGEATGTPRSGLLALMTDLCHVQSARASSEVGRICAELIFGYRRHPAWDEAGCASCFVADELEGLDELIPGIGATARFYSDVIETDGTHPAKAGPCASTAGLEPFLRMRGKLDGCLTGSRLAKDRAADALTRIVIPDEPSYPLRGR